jgi:hypothetical protein
LAAIEPYNCQPHRPADRSVKILVEDVGEFASRHGYSIHRHDEVAAMDASFGCGQIFHYVHYGQRTTVVRLRLIEELSKNDSDRAAVVR